MKRVNTHTVRINVIAGKTISTLLGTHFNQYSLTMIEMQDY
jgi:hypothetical protein